MSRLVFLPILLLISGANVASGLPSSIVDLGCQCHVWSFFQYCRSRVSMSRLVFLPILLISGVNVTSGPILSISGVNVTSGLPSNIVDLECQYRVWSSLQYCRSRCQCHVWSSSQYRRSRVSMSRLVFLPIFLISCVNVASSLPSNIVDLRCLCRVWSSFQYCQYRV